MSAAPETAAAVQAAPLADTARLCIHTMTTRPWSLAQCAEGFARAGATGITVWRNVLEAPGLAESARILRGSGLSVISLCRGGFFPADTPAGRAAAVDDNRRAVDEAAAIGAPLVVLVCGAVPGMPLAEARRQITDGISAVAPHAAAAGVRLAIEPLHPMYADSRSAVNTLGQALDIAAAVGLPNVGVTVDCYHVWWDPELENQIARAGRERRLFSFHVCDWRVPTRDLLNDRALMGDGCIPLRAIRAMVERAGFGGHVEVEIFSDEWWAADQNDFLARVRRVYLDHT